MVANATGCSSIYGGNLPTTPWTTDADGRGPAWSNSLFEDNAEFGLGFRLAADVHTELARRRLAELRDAVGAELVDAHPGRAAAAGVGAAPRSASGWPSCKHRLDELDGRRPSTDLLQRASTTWSGAACGSSAATAGPTTSAPAGSTTCWPAGATSTCWCSTPRSTPTPAARCPRRRRSAPSPSSPPPARPCRRRTSPCRRSPTATSTSRGSRWAPIRSRPCRPSARRRPTTGRR